MSNQSVNVRSAFVARPGYYYMDADYAQIEPKLSAALAGERSLIQGFIDEKDYYTLIYALMSQTPYEQVTKTLRQIGKTIVLGQSYGQEAGGLARKLKTSFDNAKEYMDAYWSGIPYTKAAKDNRRVV